jgi:hypothetical protein
MLALAPPPPEVPATVAAHEARTDTLGGTLQPAASDSSAPVAPRA